MAENDANFVHNGVEEDNDDGGRITWTIAVATGVMTNKDQLDQLGRKNTYKHCLTARAEREIKKCKKNN